ncbi:EscU/YscU/HrcU family type III secretion system export apparatus switch protein [Desulfosediminicola flagellatus]|uniref:EscU/YscU/HrcU family type III secretion system export apparatus switch protein n=1 Tax=Desulfosediminicola flagellatus TaxID=2569541 RepID=UPI0010AD8280|nr:EscU/YscU/HrcU family type III secretion system export apparatus switch protein [Desulfosediminicola flagellatus]
MSERKGPQKAVAIIYDDAESSAPKVLASGQGLIAEKIIEKAEEAGIHIYEDPNLIELLAKVPVGDEIPVELYQTVAEVLAFVYQVNEKFKNKVRK